MAGLARISDKSAMPMLADAIRTDLDRDVRSQAIDSLQRLYIPIDSQGQLRTIFNKVKSVFSEADRPLISNGVAVDPAATGVLAETVQKDFNDRFVSQPRSAGIAEGEGPDSRFGRSPRGPEKPRARCGAARDHPYARGHSRSCTGTCA